MLPDVIADRAELHIVEFPIYGTSLPCLNGKQADVRVIQKQFTPDLSDRDYEK